ncbi:prephenate dehydrogenase dimerization domain-containing protein [Paracoccus spongiarum]|uniref:Prephenate dehydrogenase/arogenate dehydrogenase family protein n=1 Tax=Paracoccus spongiarum TaxID=3064387 RepID=A0ABT9JCR3_9RHOB|nr:prephenate dehydrogenase dimerization domain-containing protein [Paracoccus sp. 2205BS29-5]MDP5307617.1 prephenate dehydrogenase/arogenate dehydrogenase family protein [Paracoccus sp. 2205BS29-5]
MLTTTPDQHDRDMAVVQGLTHLVARALAAVGPLADRLTIASFRALAKAAPIGGGAGPA